MDDPEVSETEMRASEIVYKRDSGVEVAYSEIPRRIGSEFSPRSGLGLCGLSGSLLTTCLI